MTIEMTAAKIGRSMQKWEMFISPARSVRHGIAGLASCKRLRFTLLQSGGGGVRGRGDFQRRIGNHANRAVDHHPFTGLETIGNEPVVAMPRTDFNYALMAFRVVVDHPDEMAF